MFAPGQLVDNKYRIGRMIGQGGMGAVYEAEAVLLHRRVAIKVQTLSHGSVASGELAMRFQLEAQAAGRIGSRHIVDVIDLGRLESGEHFMVMEYLDGQSLRDRIDARGGMTPQELHPIALQLLAGVSAAHAAGIVHRDLKPENVFLVRQADGSDFVKILDFGISKFNDIRGSQGGQFSLTRTGALMGTPRYLSPEQAMGGRAVDQRTDIYMVGVILYECLTGVVPYGANTFNELLFQIVQDVPRPIREQVPGADPSFAAAIECAMHKDPGSRFQSADAMSETLRAIARGQRFATPGPSGPPAAPTVVSPTASPVARLSDRTGMGPPPNESAAKSWARNDSIAGGVANAEPAPSRSKLPWIGAAVAVVLAGAAVAAFLPQRPADETALSAPLPTEALPPANAEKPNATAQGALPPPVAPVVSAAPIAAPPAVPAVRAQAAARRDTRTTPPVAPEAAPPAATQATAKETEAPPAASTNLQRVQGGGRIIRGNL